MSLINDALKRARETQAQTPPEAPNLHLRPAEPDQFARHSLGVLLPVGLAVVALLGLFFTWRLVQKPSAPSSQEVRANAPAPETPRPATLPAAVSPTLQVKVKAPPVTSPAPTPAASVPATPAPADATAATASTDTNGAPVDVAPPKPAPLKLQVIVYTPRRPSAMISGKTVFIGDRVGEFHVVAIDKESATLVSGTQTNVLSLDQ